MALTKSGQVYAWGYNYYGQLGQGNSGSTNLTIPTQITASVLNTPADPVVQLVVGASCSFALTKSGKVYAWGYNNSGQLGLGDSGSGTNRTTPTQITASGLNTPADQIGRAHV